MIHNRIDIWDEGEYGYRASYGFVPNIRTYIHEDGKNRPNLLVIPGGAYCMVCAPEGEFIAKEFYERGMNTFVLTYTTDITTAVPLNKQPLMDASRAVRVVRKTMYELMGEKEKTFIAGFSAGGHLAASLAVHYMDLEDTSEKYKDFTNRPDGAVLSYPVISFERNVESFSKLTLVGPNPSEELNDYFSLEKQVTDKTVPCFIWHTCEDGLVPCQNSLMFAGALREKNVKHELHIFSHGDHGLSLANKAFFECEDFGGSYVTEQLTLAIEAVRKGKAVDITENRTRELMEQFPIEPKEAPCMPKKDYREYEDVAMWPDMAYRFLTKL